MRSRFRTAPGAVLGVLAIAILTGAAPQATSPDPLTQALLLESKGQVDSALALLRHDATGSPQTRAEMHLAAARMLARHHHFQSALTEGQEGLSANPSDGFAYLEVAQILDQSGRHAAAIALAQQAARQDPAVQFAANDLIFRIETHWGSALAASPRPAPAAPRPAVPRLLWAVLGLSLSLLGAGFALFLRLWPSRRKMEPADAQALERVVPATEVEPGYAFGRQLAPGDAVGPYRIVRLVSSSLHSTLYQAEDMRLRRPVALKQANPLGVQSEAALARFHKEVQSLIALSNHHDGVVKVFDYLPPATLVTEWVEGQNLDAVEGDLGVDRLLQIAIELCDVLASAHEMAIIHRDIKPSNVMVTKAGHVKLLDFGIAKNAALGTSHLTADSGVPIGTFTYMAPEQFASPDQARPESDLYSLGLSLYRLIAGRLPASPWLGPRTFGLMAPEAFAPVTEEAPAVARFLATCDPGSDRGWVSELDRVLRKAFREDPSERYRQAADFKRDLERVLARVLACVRP